MAFQAIGKEVDIPLGPQSDPGRSSGAGASLLINCFVEPIQGGKVPYAIHSDMGLRDFVDIGGAGAIRGFFALGNLFYVVSGEKLYRLTSVGAKTEIGTILGQFPVIFTPNRKAPDPQIVITADTKNYVLTGNVLTEMTDPDLPAGVHSTTFLQGRTIYGIRDGRFYPSAVNDATDIDATRFAEAEFSADNGVRIFTNGDELWYYGTQSLEIFRPTGRSTSPFEPLQGSASGKGSGALSKYPVAMFDNAPHWVTDTCVFARADGYSAREVSNAAVERDIQAAKDAGSADQILGFEWARDGHWFYQLCLPNATWVVDAKTKLWHKKTSYLRNRAKFKFLVEAFDKILVGEDGGTKIYEMTADAHDEAGEPLITAVQSGIVSGFPNGGIIDAVWIDCDMGVGQGTDPHSADPQMMLEVTKDGGKEWSSPRMRPLGAAGHYRGRPRWNRLGEFGPQGFACRFSCSAPVSRAIFQAKALVRPRAAI